MGRLATVTFAAVAASATAPLYGCGISVDAAGAQFSCGDDRRCPSGTICFQNLCVATLPGELDASVDAAECPGYREAVLADAPLQYLRFAEATGPLLLDSSGLGNDAAIFQGSTPPSFRVPGALTGDDDPAIQFTAPASGDSPAFARFDGIPASWNIDFTAEVLVRPLASVAGRAGAIFVTEEYLVNGVRFAMWEDGRLQVWCNESGCASAEIAGGSIAFNTWSHVVLVKQGTTFTVYVNGTPALVGTLPDFQPPASGGFWGPAQGMPMTVQLDEAALYDRALPAARIAEHARLFREGRPATCP